MDTRQRVEPFRGLLLRYRGRTRLSQRQFAQCIGVNRRSFQQWETGVSYPSAQRLEAIIQVLLEAQGLTPGHEAAEAQALWTAVELEAPRLHGPFDTAWFARLQAERATLPGATGPAAASILVAPISTDGAQRGTGHCDWGDAPDTGSFVDRAVELALLRRWVLDERSRVVVVQGMGGIGKSWLAAKLAHEVAPSFERVYWRGLRDAPAPGEWLTGAIGFLSDRQLVAPASESEQIAALLQLLRDRRCLLVLNNCGALFEPGQQEGRYRAGMAGFGRLFEVVGEATHQSCLMLTSREAPPELSVRGGDAVRSLELGGFGIDEAQALLAPEQLVATRQQWTELLARFGGNCLALKVIGATARELFGGDIGTFLEEQGAGSVFSGIRRPLAEQVERGSTLEQRVLRLLAVDREPVAITQLLANLGPSFGRGAVLEAVEALRRRSLVERTQMLGSAAFRLPSLVLEYVTDRLVADVSDEIGLGRPVLLVEQAMIQAGNRDEVRQSQERLIGVPIVQQLRARYGESGAQERLLALLDGWRGRPPMEQGFGPGNVVNLLRLLRGDLRRLDFARVAIRRAYLADVDMQDTSFVDAQLIDAVLAEGVDFPSSIALSGDGGLLAVGTSTGQVLLWRVADRTPEWTIPGHNGAVFGVALSADGQLLASGGTDGTVRLWEAGAGQPVATLHGHTGMVWDVALSADGRLLASSAADGTVRLWEAPFAEDDAVVRWTGRKVGRGYRPTVPSRVRQVATLQGQTSGVWGVALSADGQLVAGVGADGTVQLWESYTGQPLATLEGHARAVRRVSMSADGRLVATGGLDGTVRLWEGRTGQLLASLQGQTGGVWGVALSADGQLVAGGGADGTVRLWEARTGQPVATLQGHTGVVWAMALSADGQLVASGGVDGTVRLWQSRTGQPVATLQGQTGGVWGVALSANGQVMVGGHADGTVRLWEARPGQPLATLQGHAGGVRCVAVSADGHLLASGGEDGRVRLWDAASPSKCRPVATMQGQNSIVWGVALSADGQLLACGGADGTVRLWEARTGQHLTTLQGHAGGVRCVALSADGHLLASGDEVGTLRLWSLTGVTKRKRMPGIQEENDTGRPVAASEGHAGGVWGVALCADGRLVASGCGDGTVQLMGTSSERVVASLRAHIGLVCGVALSADGQFMASAGVEGTVRVWEVGTGRPLATLPSHAGGLRCVALSADGTLLATGSLDGTVTVWRTRSGDCLRTIRAERRYERLDITGLTGVTSAQRAALLTLGAVEHAQPGRTRAPRAGQSRRRWRRRDHRLHDYYDHAGG